MTPFAQSITVTLRVWLTFRRQFSQGSNNCLGARNCFTFLQTRFTVFSVFFWAGFKKSRFRAAQMINTYFITQKKDKVIREWRKEILFCNITGKKYKNTKNTNDYCAVVCNMVGEWYPGILARITSVRSSIPLTSAQSPYQEYVYIFIYSILYHILIIISAPRSH